MLKIGFDEEVGEESVEHFRKSLQKAMSPQSFHETFAFRGAMVVPVANDQKRKDKYHTLRYIRSNRWSNVGGGYPPPVSKTTGKIHGL